MFEDKAWRCEQIAEILVEAALREYKKDWEKAVQGSGLSPMSGQRQADKPISQHLKELRNFWPKMTGQNGHIFEPFCLSPGQ